jgi:hypothetical protein
MIHGSHMPGGTRALAHLVVDFGTVDVGSVYQIQADLSNSFFLISYCTYGTVLYVLYILNMYKTVDDYVIFC